jgi:4-aminobutyrate aminotransferase / (S)-3-amino-2-methylpropionate transaminase / 5-aminovalerate transaminase
MEPAQLLPELRTQVPGPSSRTWSVRMAHVAAPMGPAAPSGATPHGLVFARAHGVNVWDVDGNRFVDLAAGFGSLLLGHRPADVERALELQRVRLWQAMGDLYSADAKIGLLEQLCRLFPVAGARGILGQSGADAVSAALKTAVLATGKHGVLAFQGAYHGLSYGPLAACGLRKSYREPFAAQLNPTVEWLPFPGSVDLVEPCLEQARALLATGRYGALLFEPILGRGGVVPMLPAAAQALRELTREHGALFIADEIWTGLGRSGHWLYSSVLGVVPDVICLGKGLGGGLPISACIGAREVMDHWRQEAEVVHTSTFSGAPLACAAALATLDVLGRKGVVDRARTVAETWKAELSRALSPFGIEARGAGMMLGFDVGRGSGAAGAASLLAQRLLQRGYISSTGGGARETLVLTPPLTTERSVLEAFTRELSLVLGELRSAGVGAG